MLFDSAVQNCETGCLDGGKLNHAFSCMSISLVRLLGFAWLALASGYAQAPTNPPLAKDPGPFLPSTPAAQARGPRAVAGPAPHFPDGRPDFGGNGAWFPGFNGNLAETTWKGVKSADTHVDVPFLPWTLKTFNERVENLAKDDPEARCLPVGVPRFMFDPYAFQMIQTRDQVVFVFDGDNYLWRIVTLDPSGTHPKNLKPTWLGDSVGHYEGDTLVVDVTGFNGLAWLDQAGHATSDKLHLTERYTRTDSLTLKYEVTIEDPGAYSKPWTATNTVRWRPGLELMENICQEDEKSSIHMIGNAAPEKQ
jgi:hypothetical protein